MQAIDEKAAFSARLLSALKRAGIKNVSPTYIAREFNRRYPGKAVTTQAVRKWIAGESIPVQEKIRVLSEWLGVSAQWLRFGGAERTPRGPRGAASALRKGGGPCGDSFCAGYEKLSDRHKEMVREMVRALLKLEQE